MQVECQVLGIHIDLMNVFPLAKGKRENLNITSLYNASMDSVQ